MREKQQLLLYADIVFTKQTRGTYSRGLIYRFKTYLEIELQKKLIYAERASVIVLLTLPKGNVKGGEGTLTD